MSAVAAHIRAFYRKGKLVGPAFAMKTRPEDNLMVHKGSIWRVVALPEKVVK